MAAPEAHARIAEQFKNAAWEVELTTPQNRQFVSTRSE
jgi:hypothetical protein